MKRKKLIVATLVAALLGCSTPEATRRAEIAKIETQVRAEIRRLVESGKFAEANNYQHPKTGKPYLDIAADAVRQSEVREYVQPKWIEWHDRQLNDGVMRFVEQRKFGEAREYIWQYGGTGVAEVDVQVDAIRYRLLAEKVNVVELDFMQKDLSATYLAASKANTVAELVEAKRKIVGYPVVRTYSTALDGSLDRVRDALVAVNVPESSLIPILSQTRRMISDCFAERKSTVRTEEKAGPDLQNSRTRLAEFQADLQKYGCNAKQAETVAGAFEKEVKPFLDAAVRQAKGRPNVVALGTASINDRAEKIRKGLIERIDRHVMELLTTQTLGETRSALARPKPDFEQIRHRLLKPQTVGDDSLDVQFLALRVGLLNALVNPAQCAAMLGEMRAIVDEVGKQPNDADKLVSAYDRLCAMKMVDDEKSYADAKACLVRIGEILRKLDIADVKAEEYVLRKTMELVAAFDRRNQTFVEKTERDLQPLVEGLKRYEAELARHFAATDATYATRCKGTAWNEVQAMLKKGVVCMTTRELKEKVNEGLLSCRRQLLPMLRKVKAEAARKKAEEFAAEENAERLRDLRSKLSKVDYDWQVQMALGRIDAADGHDPWGFDGMNALLGEYARLNRLFARYMKEGQGDKVDELLRKNADALVTLLSGAAYLGQDQFAQTLAECAEGQDLNAVPLQDPRKRTPLLMTIQYSRVNMLEMVLTNACQPNLSVADADGNGVSHYVAQSGNMAMLSALSDQIDVSQTNKAGETALFVAVRQDNRKMIQALVSNKNDRVRSPVAYVDRTNAAGETAFVVACSGGCLSALQALADLNATYGNEALVAAVKADQHAVVRWLVENGVDRGISVNAPGVMAAAQPGSQTERYLVSQGGIRLSKTPAEPVRDASAMPGKVKYFLCEVPVESVADGASATKDAAAKKEVKK